MELLSVYLDNLRRQLRDEGQRRIEEFLGNGTRTTWILRDIPILSGSVSVYIDGDICETSDYSIDLTNGTLVFEMEPDDGSEIEVIYTAISYEDDFLVSYLKNAVVGIESIYSVGFAVSGSGLSTYSVSPDPTNDMILLWSDMAKFMLRSDNLKQRAEDAIDFRDGDKAINESATLRVLQGILEGQLRSILDNLDRMKFEGITGFIRSGGAIPLTYPSVGESTGSGVSEYLWWNGEILEGQER